MFICGSRIVARRFAAAEKYLLTPAVSFHQSTSVVADPLGLDKDYDLDQIVFPRNRLEKGTDYELNWSLCAKRVAPNIHAFRNLDDKGLMMRSSGSLGQNKALVVKDGNGHLKEVENAADCEVLVEAVKDQLSNVIDLFVHDGALGSHSICESRIRVVTDSPELALAMKHLLVQIPLKLDSRKQGNVMTVFIATGADMPTEANLAIVDATVDDGPKDIEIAIGGAPSFAALQQFLETQAMRHLCRPDSTTLPLRCTSYVTANNQTALLFNDLPAPAPIAHTSNGSTALNGAHCHVWSPLGISRVFGGAVVDSAALEPSRGSVVFQSPPVMVQPLPEAANVVPHPTKVIFVSSKAIAGEVDAETLQQWVEAAGHSPEDAAVFKNLVQEHQVEIRGAASEDDAMALLSS